MKLIGICKREFLKTQNTTAFTFEKLPEPCQQALIIEFLDTMRYKGIPLFEYCFIYFWKHKIYSQSFNDICEQSIEKANEIFNLNNK